MFELKKPVESREKTPYGTMFKYLDPDTGVVKAAQFLPKKGRKGRRISHNVAQQVA